jgi:hypothetical protein
LAVVVAKPPAFEVVVIKRLFFGVAGFSGYYPSADVPPFY